MQVLLLAREMGMLKMGTVALDGTQVHANASRDKLHALPAELGKPTILLADDGYFSAANVTACRSAQIEPLIVAGRQPHHPSLSDRFAEPPPAPSTPQDESQSACSASATF